MPATFAPKPLDPALSKAFDEVSSRFAKRFESEGKGPKEEVPALAAHRFSLGPATVARAVRCAKGRGFADRVADLGVHVTRSIAESSDAEIRVRSSLAGPVVAAIVTARAEVGAGAHVEVDPLAEAHRAWIEDALEPLGAHDVTVSWADAEKESARASVVVAPYYYQRSDLDRIALELALELVLPCPHAEGGLTMLLPRGWEQRTALWDKVRKLVETWGLEPRPSELHVLEAGNTAETLDIAREHVDGGALAAFVYPMWRERRDLEARLKKLAACARLTVMNHRPSLAWALGVGGARGDVFVDADQRLRHESSKRAASGRARYEIAPSVGGAIAVTLSAWTGL